MIENFPFFLMIIIVILLLIMLANKVKVAYPILLVVAGLIISLIPGVPRIEIEPELIFMIFLPPLLYEASWSISWKELWRWRRVITSFAFVVVFITALSVAFAANYFIPGFSLALGFLLGGIVSPPDAVSAGAILKFVKVPKRMSSILEGESLLNDASSLIIFRFALIAVATGQFIWYEAALSFSWMIIGGAGIGVLVGWLFMKAHKYLPADANIDTVLTLITPYIMYIAAEGVQSSGVLSVVCGGLFLSNKRYYFLSSASRLRGVNVWESFVFILNGVVFLMIGLDLPQIVSGLNDVSFSAAIGYGLLITAVIIIVRILAAYSAVIMTLLMKNFITVADDRNPGWKVPLVMGWSGMRGVVSLAAALSIPVYLNNGEEFPQRNLILFITFVVILVTLLLQGLTLPYLIKKIRLPSFDDYIPEEEAEITIKQQLAKQSFTFITEKYSKELEDNAALKLLADKWNFTSDKPIESEFNSKVHSIYLEVLDHQRQWLLLQNREENLFDEEILAKYLHQLDLEEEKIRGNN